MKRQKWPCFLMHISIGIHCFPYLSQSEGRCQHQTRKWVGWLLKERDFLPVALNSQFRLSIQQFKTKSSDSSLVEIAFSNELSSFQINRPQNPLSSVQAAEDSLQLPLTSFVIISFRQKSATFRLSQIADNQILAISPHRLILKHWQMEISFSTSSNTAKSKFVRGLKIPIRYPRLA